MENSNQKAVYKLNLNCGRMGDLQGVFIAKKSFVEHLIKSEIQVYFGEVLGKHSEIYGKVEESEIELVTDEQLVIDVIEKHGLENGYNPFHYTALGQERDDFEDLTIGEIFEILEKEGVIS